MKALDFKFDEKYIGKTVICNYITYGWGDNVYMVVGDDEDPCDVMDHFDLWDDYYLYVIGSDRYAYHIEL